MNMTVALAGNPNSGKTTLFNALTGSNQYVGNWPGVTVERKEAFFEIGDDHAVLVDLPGVYSLSPYSIEEKITRRFIAEHRPDVVLNIVDATNLERNLYLTLQLMELERPVVVALNLMDELERRGETIDCARLSEALGVPIIPISAKKKRGFDALFTAIHAQAHHPRLSHPSRNYDESTRDALREISEALDGSTAWTALKLLEGDETARLSEAQRARVQAAVNRYVERGQKNHPCIDALTLAADARYQYIADALKRSGFRRREREVTLSDRIDRVVTHKALAFPIFFAVMALMFAVTFGSVGSFLTKLTESLIEGIAQWADAGLTAARASEWVRSLVTDGVIAGVGGVMVFLPQILLIFLFMSVLEDSGYMARAAFITDRLLRRFGLSGRSFIPMLMGFGCTTTAIVAARGVENERDRRMTILLTPFMSCGARLPVYGLFTAALFPKNKAAVVLSLYALGMLMMVLCGLVLRKTAFREGDSPFLMELPPYRMPHPKSVLRRLTDRAKDFLTRAGTLIFAMSVLIWFLQSFTPSLQWAADSSRSIFGRIGTFIAPLFAPLGFGEWQKVVAMMSGFVAKEAVVSTLQVLYGAGSAGELTSVIAAQFTPLSAYAFLVFILLYVPCVAALAAAKRELRSSKYFAMSILIQMGTAYGVTLLVYQIGRLLLGG